MKTITKDQVQEKLDDIRDTTLINTLPEEEFDNFKIPGSINVPGQLDDFVERVSMMVMNNKDADLIVYCASSKCDSAEKAGTKLDEAGFNNVFHYVGGAAEWLKQKQTS